MNREIETAKKSGPTSKDNPEYKKLHTQISALRANLRQVEEFARRASPTYRYGTKSTQTRRKEQIKERLKKILKLEKQRKLLKSKISAPGYRIYYVRYADDFLIGVNGRKCIAEKMKASIKKFLKDQLQLELNSEKTKITSAIKSRAVFLATNIRAMTSRTHNQPERKNSMSQDQRKIRARRTSGNIALLVPIQRIIEKLSEQGMCRRKIEDVRKHKCVAIPKRKTAWINLSLTQIIQKYNYFWRGILNYYSFAYNRSQLNVIQYLIQHSAACTVMNKMKMTSRAQVFKKYGSDIKIKEGDIISKLHILKSLVRMRSKQIWQR
jgi:hypothetical protein